MFFEKASIDLYLAVSWRRTTSYKVVMFEMHTEGKFRRNNTSTSRKCRSNRPAKHEVTNLTYTISIISHLGLCPTSLIESLDFFCWHLVPEFLLQKCHAMFCRAQNQLHQTRTVVDSGINKQRKIFLEVRDTWPKNIFHGIACFRDDELRCWVWMLNIRVHFMDRAQHKIRHTSRS